jgi:hypothetical protein
MNSDRVKLLLEDLVRRGFIQDSGDETVGWVIRNAIETALSDAIEEDRLRVAQILAVVAGPESIPAHRITAIMQGIGV